MRKPIMSEKNFKVIMIAFVGWIAFAMLLSNLFKG